MPAKLALGSVSGASMLQSREEHSAQDSSCEDDGNAKFCPNRHLQVPDGPQRQKQNQDIRNDVDRACDYKVKCCVYAMAWDGSHPCLVHRIALEDDREHVCGVEANVEPHED